MLFWRRFHRYSIKDAVADVHAILDDLAADIRRDMEDMGRLVKDVKLPSPNDALKNELEMTKRELEFARKDIERLNTQIVTQSEFIQKMLNRYIEKSVCELPPKIEVKMPEPYQQNGNGQTRYYTIDQLKAMSLSEKKELGIVSSYGLTAQNSQAGPKGRLP